MKLKLQELFQMNPKLRGYFIDLPKFGGLALQRATHISPVRAQIDHDSLKATSTIEWQLQDLKMLEILDKKRVTEEGAEAVALAYVYAKAGWMVKRRFNQGEKADWLLQNEFGSLALEVSGTIAGEPLTRLKEKKRQVSGCTLPADRLAVVVAFAEPLILAGSP